ncbi:MAG TPA: aldolase/citrate lyase family protein [Candidatus Limnocylindrales bacterium]|jgi:4-hydroxy-2-oxoheptanedioate aldolase
MTSVNPLLALWRAGKPSLGGWLTTSDPQIAEYLATGGFDEICVDQQHGIVDSAALASCFRALELHGVAPTTRVPANDFAAIGFALDVGAVAIVVPMVNSAAEAAAAADACHYPPRGHRSVGPLRGPFVRASERLDALDEAACVVMIETPDGIENVDAIAATPGVDAIYIGPGDLALGLGLSAWPTDWTPAEAKLHADTVERIRQSCVAHGVAPGMHTGDGATARRYLEQGFQMVTVTNELGLITVGAQAHLAMARGETASAVGVAAI